MVRRLAVGLCAAWAVVFILCAGAFEARASAESDIDYLAMAETMERKNGLFDILTEPEQGLVLMSLPAPDPETGIVAETLYMSYLRTGLGSNPVGLDRGLGGDSLVLRFEVHGDMLLMTAQNTRYTARSDNTQERKATEESFARSVIHATKILARDAETGVIFISLTDFLDTDPIGIAERLKSRGQGSFSLNGARSVPVFSEFLTFPDNVELEAQLTFTSTDPGSEVAATAPAPQAVTLTVHHSFIRLPDDGYTPRPADPRVGNISIPFTDYAAGLKEPLTRRFAIRHRLEKTDPAAERSPAKDPIVFYVDPGAPKAVRDALIEGASWWAEAFEAAGFEDGYRVEVLPKGAHPLDARYNVINWVHRQTRGWSYGRPVIDPRTGEIVKAVITLGSLRVRHDRRIFEGLLDAKRTGTGGPNDPLEIALARLRQLSAHEVGHGLGFVHNMAASADGRASVMDYPAPLVGLTGDGLDFSKAYDSGIGAWDIATVKYVYAEVPDGPDGHAALTAMAAEARANHLFVADAHSRPVSGAHPKGSVWDNGADATTELERVLEVRRRALRDFGLDNLPDGAPISELRQVLVPIYLYHRYQVAAAAKAIGGVTFSYGLAGLSSPDMEAMRPVSKAAQDRALEVLLRTVTPASLALPQGLVDVLQPVNINWYTDRYTRDEFRSDAYPVFDEVQAASVAAGLTFGALLNQERLVRMMQLRTRDASLPSIETYLNTIAETVFAAPDADPNKALIQEAVAHRYVQDLATVNAAAPPMLSVEIDRHMEGLKARIAKSLAGHPKDRRRVLIRRISQYFDHRAESPMTGRSAPRTPPGSPIGMAPHVLGQACDTCWFCEDDL